MHSVKFCAKSLTDKLSVNIRRCLAWCFFAFSAFVLIDKGMLLSEAFTNVCIATLMTVIAICKMKFETC